MKRLYTAIGRFERRTDRSRRTYPLILLGGQEYMLDYQEMLLWTCLRWRIAGREEIEGLYKKTCHGAASVSSRPLDQCIQRLLMRGLLVSGTGDTDYDALYDLLSALYVVPVCGKMPLRFITFCKLVLVNHLPFRTAKKVFRTDTRTPREEEVMHLAAQELLSSAEIIKCVEKDIRYLPGEESILENLYDDEETTSENISCLVKSAPSSRSVTLAIANLYLRQQIIFERM